MPKITTDMSPRDILTACNGYYECPRGQSGARIGPLVGYAATYMNDAQECQYVGDHYVNFSKIEQWPVILAAHIAPRLKKLIRESGVVGPYTLCGAPEGGKMLASQLGAEMSCRVIYPEKTVVEHGTGRRRSKTRLFFNGRHEVHAEERIIFVEDVCNNFSTTSQFIEEVTRLGGEVLAIACFLNRSPDERSEVILDGRHYPVFSLWQQPMPEYRQDDPAISRDVERCTVEFRPKDSWRLLMEVMGKYDTC